MAGCHCIRTAAGTGTAFLHANEQGSYFVTAAHLVHGTQEGDYILFKRQDGWHSVQVREILLHLQGYDVAVFSTANFGTTTRMVPRPDAGIFLGDELKFLGFPHGLGNTYPLEGSVAPLVRTAFFSGTIMVEGREIELLDGFNNPGFSGGPVYALQDDGEPSITALISGYRFERMSNSRLYRSNADGREEEVPDLYTKPNSGMINAISVSHIRAVAAGLSTYNRVRDEQST